MMANTVPFPFAIYLARLRPEDIALVDKVMRSRTGLKLSDHLSVVNQLVKRLAEHCAVVRGDVENQIMGDVTNVDGIERHPTLQSGLLDTSIDLRHCRMCGSVCGFRENGLGYLRAECANTSCGIATPYHYKTREDAAYAWNRKPGDAPKRA